MAAKTLIIAGLASMTFVGFVACGNRETADTHYPLTGTEEMPLTDADGGAVICPTPDKVLICHIPSGNPANLHTLCVGAAAVEAHVTHHGDTAGECAVTDAGVAAPVDEAPEASEAPEVEPVETPEVTPAEGTP